MDHGALRVPYTLAMRKTSIYLDQNGAERLARWPTKRSALKPRSSATRSPPTAPSPAAIAILPLPGISSGSTPIHVRSRRSLRMS